MGILESSIQRIKDCIEIVKLSEDKESAIKNLKNYLKSIKEIHE